MKHSVLVRQAEIDRWANLEPKDALEMLNEEKTELEDDLFAAELPEPLVGPVTRSMRHLKRWVEALEQLNDD